MQRLTGVSTSISGGTELVGLENIALPNIDLLFLEIEVT